MEVSCGRFLWINLYSTGIGSYAIWKEFGGMAKVQCWGEGVRDVGASHIPDVGV